MSNHRASGSGNTSLPNDSLVPIRTVSSLTGVNSVTLRAWERRYGLIQPTRTPKGHRLYSMADVSLINQIVTLLEGGISISQVHQVLQQAPTPLAPESAATEIQAQRFDLWANYQKRLVEAIIGFDEAELDSTYNEILALYPIDIVTNRLIIPLLRELGWRWQRGNPTGVAEEHYFSVFLRNKLGARFHHRSRFNDGPTLIVACLPEEQHEVGTLLFSLMAIDWNYRVILLGANMPLEQLPALVERIDAQAVVLAGTYASPKGMLSHDLPRLVQRLAVAVFIGGKITSRHQSELTAAGVIALSEDLHEAIRSINRALLPQADSA